MKRWRLDKLIANTNVVVTGKDSSSASADGLYVEMRDGHAHVTLFGSPMHDAVVKNKTSTMTGPMIHLSPHDQTASVDGPGTFEGLSQPKDPRQKPRPLKLSWLQKATLDGNTNQVLVIGGVVATSNDPNGSHAIRRNAIIYWRRWWILPRRRRAVRQQRRLVIPAAMGQTRTL